MGVVVGVVWDVVVLEAVGGDVVVGGDFNLSVVSWLSYYPGLRCVPKSMAMAMAMAVAVAVILDNGYGYFS